MRALVRLVPIVITASLVFAVAALPVPARAPAAQPKDADKPTVFFNATIYTGSGDKPIEKGFLLVKGGKIEAVGTEKGLAQFPFAEPAEQIDLKGAVVIPGLVDTHSHIGVWSRPGVSANADLSETSGPVQPSSRALDAINPDDPGIRMATAGGVTTANIMPGSANVIGGQTLYVKLRGRTVEEMRVTGLFNGVEIVGGLKMANGENPKGYGKNKQQAPFTRMKVAALQRETFQKAKEYKAKLDAGQKPERDISLEPLVEVLEGKRTVHFHCHRADDLMTAVRIAEEFKFELVLQHATEGYRVAEILAKKKIPASLTLIDAPGGKAETIGLLEENAAILDKAGVTVAINTDDSITESRFLLRTGSIAVRGGMSEAAALKALTLTPAKLMHLDHRIGSLEKGKDADFVILSGAPFSLYTQVLATYIDGKKVFDRSEKRDWTYQAGGFALADNGKEVPATFAPMKAPQPVKAPERDMRLPPLGVPGPATVLVRAARIHTAAGKVIENGEIVIDNGRITEIRAINGPPVSLNVFYAAEVTPGLIDSFSVAGLTCAWNIPADQDQDELSDPNQADLRVYDGFNPREPLLEFLQATGVTVVHTTPGRKNVIAGQSGIFRTDGSTVDSAAVKPVASILVNLGEEPKATYKGKAPDSRMGTAALVRKAFAEAQVYKAKKATPGVNTPGSPKLEALIPALEGKIPVYFAAHRKDDIATALRIAEEFKLKPVIALGTEAYRMAAELKKAGVPVVVHPTMQRAGASMETLHAFVGNAAALDAAGVPVTLCTGFEGYVPKVRVLRYEAAMAVGAGGLDHARALRAVTIDAAKLLGIDKDYGSIEKGKVADLVLYDGDPFEHTTNVTQTLMGGKVVYSRDDYLKLPFERRILPLIAGGPGNGCCLAGW
jgi:imidazolonepropionase-like amidohydrolase